MTRTLTLTLVVLGLIGSTLPARADPTATSKEVSRLLGSSDGRTGTLEGLPAEYRFQTAGRYGDQVTTLLNIKLATPGLLLQVRRRDPSDDDLKRDHWFLDVPLDDAPFAAAYVVEGAPSDLVRALLDEPLRKALLDERRTVLNVDADYVELLVGGSITAPEDAARLIALGSMVVKRLQAGLSPAAGSALSDADRAKELAHLKTLRERRHNNTLAGVIPAAVVGCLLIGLLIWNMRRKRRA